MTLTTGPDCGHAVSRSAPFCPNCGRPGGVDFSPPPVSPFGAAPTPARAGAPWGQGLSLPAALGGPGPVQGQAQGQGPGKLLLAGIILVPYVFAWVTLQRKYSRTTRWGSLAWMVVYLFIVLGQSPDHPTPPAAASAPRAATPSWLTPSPAPAPGSPREAGRIVSTAIAAASTAQYEAAQAAAPPRDACASKGDDLANAYESQIERAAQVHLMAAEVMKECRRSADPGVADCVQRCEEGFRQEARRWFSIDAPG